MYKDTEEWNDNWGKRERIELSKDYKKYLPLVILDKILSTVYANYFEMKGDVIPTILKMGGNYIKDPNDSEERTQARYKLGLEFLVKEGLMIQKDEKFALTYAGTIKHLNGGFIQEIAEKEFYRKKQLKFWTMPVYAFIVSLIALLLSIVTLILSNLNLIWAE
jgi:hypothetical protein